MYHSLQKSLTALPSPDDYHDKIYEISTEESLNKKLPSQFDYRQDLLPIQNQESTYLCLAMAGACIKEWQEKKDINFNDRMSANFIYHLRASAHQVMTGRELLEILKNKGSLPEKLYNNQKPTQHDLIRAKQFKIDSYSRVVSIIGLKRALCENGPALMLMPVYNINNDFWKPTKPNQLRLGGQSLVVVGYDKKGFWLRNSWGKKFGKDGYVHYPYSDWGYHWEVWTLCDKKTSVLGLSVDLDFDFEKFTDNSNLMEVEPGVSIDLDIDPDSTELVMEISNYEDSNQDGDDSECPRCLEIEDNNQFTEWDEPVEVIKVSQVKKPSKVSFRNPTFIPEDD